MSNWRWRNWKGHTKKKLIIKIKENFASAKNTFASKFNMEFELHQKRFKIKCEGNQKLAAVNSFNDYSPWKNSIEKICHKWVKQSSGLICNGNYFSYKNTQWYNKQKYWVWQWTDISNIINRSSPSTRLLGRFLLWDPNINREASVFLAKNSWKWDFIT